jgi:hypothetical protein
VKFDFEELIWEASLKIKKETRGYSISPDAILQIIFLLVKGAIRVDLRRVKESDLENFIKIWADLEGPLRSFFNDFLYREFKVTHEKIINVKLALIPLIVYFYYMKTVQNKKFRDFSVRSIKNMKKYFIYSQLLYWNLQSNIDNSQSNQASVPKKECPFSVSKIEKYSRYEKEGN